MEHIDDKMTRLEMYHRVINDIATALGYRMGDTFEPEALVKQVEKLAALKPVGDALVSYFNGEASEDNLYTVFCGWRSSISDVTPVYVDDEGYPTEAALGKIVKWDYKDGWTGLLEFVGRLWAYADAGYWSMEKDVVVRDLPNYKVVADVYHLSTAGWSGNESIIRALEKNWMFWTFCWEQSKLGGHYIFDVKNEELSVYNTVLNTI